MNNILKVDLVDHEFLPLLLIESDMTAFPGTNYLLPMGTLLSLTSREDKLTPYCTLRKYRAKQEYYTDLIFSEFQLIIGYRLDLTHNETNN